MGSHTMEIQRILVDFKGLWWW